jgi:hypothetical protein
MEQQVHEQILDPSSTDPAASQLNGAGATNQLASVLMQQFEQRPLTAVGAAFVTGFLLGRAEATDGGASSGDDLSAQFGAELDQIKTAAVRTFGDFMQQTLHSFVGPAGQPPGEQTPNGGKTPSTAPNTSFAAEAGATVNTHTPNGGKTPSTAPNASFEAGAGATGFDSPEITSSYLSNTDVGGPDAGRPYFPPGGAPDRERSGPEQGGHTP